MSNFTLGELVGECTEILGKYPHRRSEKEMLQPGCENKIQAKLRMLNELT